MEGLEHNSVQYLSVLDISSTTKIKQCHPGIKLIILQFIY